MLAQIMVCRLGLGATGWLGGWLDPRLPVLSALAIAMVLETTSGVATQMQQVTCVAFAVFADGIATMQTAIGYQIVRRHDVPHCHHCLELLNDH